MIRLRWMTKRRRRGEGVGATRLTTDKRSAFVSPHSAVSHANCGRLTERTLQWRYGRERKPGAQMTNRASSGVGSWIPAVRTVRRYRRSWLRRDVVAGIVLTAVLVPAGMGYAEAAGLPPIYGLYATIVPLSVYAIVGPSRILVLGPDSSLVPLIAAAILPLAAGDQAEAVALAGLLAVFSGLFCLLAGFARFGFLTDLLSKPVRYGYMNGIALTVLVSQLPKLFGFSTDAEGLIPEARAFVRGLANGETNMTALAVGVGCLLVIFAFKRWRPAVPGILVAVVAATVSVGVLGLAEHHDLAVVGPLPRGLPSLPIPRVSASDVGELPAGAGAVGLALVAVRCALPR